MDIKKNVEGKKEITTKEILLLEGLENTKKNQMKIGKMLRLEGYEPRVIGEKGTTRRVYFYTGKVVIKEKTRREKVTLMMIMEKINKILEKIS